MPTVPTQSLSPVQAARLLPCSLCFAAPQVPCLQVPGREADHLARYLDAYANGKISRKDMAAVFEAAEVITAYRLVTAAAVTS